METRGTYFDIVSKMAVYQTMNVTNWELSGVIFKDFLWVLGFRGNLVLRFIVNITTWSYAPHTVNKTESMAIWPLSNTTVSISWIILVRKFKGELWKHLVLKFSQQMLVSFLLKWLLPFSENLSLCHAESDLLANLRQSFSLLACKGSRPRADKAMPQIQVIKARGLFFCMWSL